jgi:hypothetical protein
VIVRPVIAVVIALALLQANGLALLCTINCSRVSSAQKVHTDNRELAVHHHSHAGHSSAASACCPTTAQVTRSMCSQPVQLAAMEDRYQTSSDFGNAPENPISWSVLSEPSFPSFSSASPPNSLARPALPTLRI